MVPSTSSTQNASEQLTCRLWQRAAGAGRHRPLHQGEVAAGLGGDGLERHDAPPRRDEMSHPPGLMLESVTPPAYAASPAAAT
jgi:hypothetical protein